MKINGVELDFTLYDSANAEMKQRYFEELNKMRTVSQDVPKEAKIINIGILLSGKGRVWMDNVSFQKVDKNIPTTDFEIQKVYPDHPENMSFEE